LKGANTVDNTDRHGDVGGLPGGWLADVPQDVIVIAAGEAVGRHKLAMVADRASANGDLWLAGRYWAILSIIVHTHAGSSWTKLYPLLSKSLDAIAAHLQRTDAPEDLLDDVHQVQMDRLACLVVQLQDEATQARSGEISKLMATRAAARDPLLASVMMLCCSAVLMKKDPTAFGRCIIMTRKTNLAAMNADPDPATRHNCSLMAYGLEHAIDGTLLGAGQPFDWDAAYGPGGATILGVARNYNYDTDHKLLLTRLNAELLVCFPGAAIALSVHYGDVKSTREVTDLSLAHLKRAIADSQDRFQSEAISCVWGLIGWAWMVYYTEMLTDKHRTAVESMMAEFGCDWAGAGAKIDAVDSVLLRQRGDTSVETSYFSSEQFEWLLRCSHVLVARKLSDRVDFVRSLPTLQELQGWCAISAGTSVANSTHGAWFNTHVACAAVCEKLQCHEKVLLYTDAALSRDVAKCGTDLPIPRVLSHSMQGRAYAALGRRADAVRAFEMAAEEASGWGLHHLEALALRDLKLTCLDDIGHGQHGSHRLGAALRLLSGPPEMLNSMLKGLDGAELMSLPAPDPDYHVAYAVEEVQEVQDPAVAALEQELRGMKLMALHGRAVDEGVAADALEAAMERDHPKNELIAALLAHSEALVPLKQAPQTPVLRRELEGLRLSTLRARAREAGVADDVLEDALDSDDPKGTLVGLLLERAEAAEAVVAETGDLKRHSLKDLRKLAREAGVGDDKLEDTIDTHDPKAAVIALLAQSTAGSPAGHNVGPAASAERESTTMAERESADSAERESTTSKERESAASAKNLTEREGLKPSQLRKRAATAGVEDAQVEAAEDSATPRESMLALILAAEAASSSGVLATFQTKLEGLKPSQLRKRAVAAGVTAASIEAAEDSATPKGDMIALILAAPPPPPPQKRVEARGAGRPHFGKVGGGFGRIVVSETGAPNLFVNLV
jgi:lambda repressor-like predicted transcriptional regulator